MKQLVLIVIILALSIQVSTEVTRKREEGEIILEKADITASKSSDDLGCLVDLVTSKEPCQVHTTGADGDVYERAWFQFSLKDKLHCVTRIDVSVKTTIRDQAHYRYTCQKSGCDVINFIEGTEKLNERDIDQYAFSGEVYVQEGEEEGRSDPSCTGMVGDNIKILAMMTDMTFYEVWVFGGVLGADEDETGDDGDAGNEGGSEEEHDKEHDYSGTLVLGISSLLLLAGFFIF